VTKITAKNVVICEDVRQEVRGKHILLGVTGPNLKVPAFPSVIGVALWISGTAKDKGPFEAHFQALDPDGSIAVEGKLVGEVAKPGPSTVVIGPMPLNVTKAGDFRFQWKFGKEKWTTIETLRIDEGPVV
jgi:hypothetical protein